LEKYETLKASATMITYKKNSQTSLLNSGVIHHKTSCPNSWTQEWRELGRRVLPLHKGICGYKTQCAIYDSFTYPSCCCTHHTYSCGDMIPLYLPNYITLSDNIKLSNPRMREATQEHHEQKNEGKEKNTKQNIKMT
jgi:hypothetical protein